MAQALRLSLLSEAYLYAGRTPDAIESAERALTLSREHKERGHEAWTLKLLGEIHGSSDPAKVDLAEAFYRQALALAEKLGMRPLVAHCHFGLGRLDQQGKRKQTREHFTIATTMYREMDMQLWLERAEVDMRELA